MRRTHGTIFSSNSKRLAPSSPVMFVRTVIFPPGRARLLMSPRPIGSLTAAKLMGIEGGRSSWKCEEADAPDLGGLLRECFKWRSKRAPTQRHNQTSAAVHRVSCLLSLSV